MLARWILESGRTRGVSFRPFPNSSGWWWLISSVFLIRISCHKTTHANGYPGAWPGWAVSISVLRLTVLLVFSSRNHWPVSPLGQSSIQGTEDPPEMQILGPHSRPARQVPEICILTSPPDDSLVSQLVKNLPAMQETPVRSLGREDPLEKG